MVQILEEQLKKFKPDLRKDLLEANAEMKAELSLIKEGVEESKGKIAELESDLSAFKNTSNSLQRKIRDEVNLSCPMLTSYSYQTRQTRTS